LSWHDLPGDGVGRSWLRRTMGLFCLPWELHRVTLKARPLARSDFPGRVYAMPIVNCTEFVLNPGGGSFKNESIAFTSNPNRLYTGNTNPTLAYVEYAWSWFHAGLAESCSLSRLVNDGPAHSSAINLLQVETLRKIVIERRGTEREQRRAEVFVHARLPRRSRPHRRHC
jgi:hypothetical protein